MRRAPRAWTARALITDSSSRTSFMRQRFLQLPNRGEGYCASLWLTKRKVPHPCSPADECAGSLPGIRDDGLIVVSVELPYAVLLQPAFPGSFDFAVACAPTTLKMRALNSTESRQKRKGVRAITIQQFQISKFFSIPPLMLPSAHFSLLSVDQPQALRLWT